MAKTPPSPNIAAEKWAGRAAGASGEFAANAAAASSEWESNAIAAGANYTAGVSQSNLAARYTGGIRRSGAGRYAERVQAVGATRYSQGVSEGQSQYAQRVTPFYQVIASTSLPARKPRGDAATIHRVVVLSDALHKARLASVAAGR